MQMAIQRGAELAKKMPAHVAAHCTSTAAWMSSLEALVLSLLQMAGIGPIVIRAKSSDTRPLILFYFGLG
jgi:hypothetical protein